MHRWRLMLMSRMRLCGNLRCFLLSILCTNVSAVIGSGFTGVIATMCFDPFPKTFHAWTPFRGCVCCTGVLWSVDLSAFLRNARGTKRRDCRRRDDRRFLVGEEARFLASILSLNDRLPIASTNEFDMLQSFFCLHPTKNGRGNKTRAGNCTTKRTNRFGKDAATPYNAEVAMSSWDTKPLPLSDQVIMRNICVRVRPVLQEMLKRMREQQTRLDALELLVLNLIQDEKT